MKSFIYGRYDVLQGVRGYEVFGYDQTLARETVKELARAFSSKDPHFKILRVLGEFFVYFPITAGEWVFGKGNVEERGEYFSYILHGVVFKQSRTRRHVGQPVPAGRSTESLDRGSARAAAQPGHTGLG